jgi:hypothetical protein
MSPVEEKGGSGGATPAGGEAKGDGAAKNDQQATTKSVKKGGRIVAIVIAVSLLLYLFGDRYTPYTSQARVDGFVVGVAPKVAGEVTKVSVINNQAVKEGQPLIEIDRSQYRIALAKARSDLANARKQVGAGGAAVEAARAALLAARANELKARQDATRLRRLREQDPGTISVRRQEIADASYEAAKAQVTAAEADIRRAIDTMGGLNIEENTILQTALTAVDKAELDMTNTWSRRRRTASSPTCAPTWACMRHRQPGADADRNPRRVDQRRVHREQPGPHEGGDAGRHRVRRTARPRPTRARCAASVWASAAAAAPHGHVADDPERPRLAAAIAAVPGDHRLRRQTGCAAARGGARRRTGCRHRLRRRQRAPETARQDLHPHRELADVCLLSGPVEREPMP